MTSTIIGLLLVLCAAQSAAFVAPSIPRHPASLDTISLARQRTTRGPTYSKTQMTAFVADYEETEKRKHEDNSKSWIPTASGGFLPNLKRRITKDKNRSKNPLIEVTTIPDYKEQVVDYDEGLVCVRFYAPWCRACKAIASRYRQLATKYPHVRFVQVPLQKDNAVLHTALGVPSLPFSHIYHPDVGLVEERSLNKKVFGDFETVLDSYVQGECPIDWEKEEEEEEPLQ